MSFLTVVLDFQRSCVTSNGLDFQRPGLTEVKPYRRELKPYRREVKPYRRELH